MDLLSAVLACGVLVNPVTTLSVMAVESAGHPYMIHNNTLRQTTLAQAAAAARQFIDHGDSVDVGLLQSNDDAWLRPTGVSLEAAFDPGTNIRLGTTLLSTNYAHALLHPDGRLDALTRALSRYNSGCERGSLTYADRVLKQSATTPRGSTSDSMFDPTKTSWNLGFTPPLNAATLSSSSCTSGCAAQIPGSRR